MFTVSGPISSSTYMTSRYAGFFVLVLAQSGRCTVAPCAASAFHRGDAISVWKDDTRAWRWRSPPFPAAPRARPGRGAVFAAASRRLSTSVSTRLTKKLATE